MLWIILAVCAFVYLVIGAGLAVYIAVNVPVDLLGVFFLWLGWPVVAAAWLYRKWRDG